MKKIWFIVGTLISLCSCSLIIGDEEGGSSSFSNPSSLSFDESLEYGFIHFGAEPYQGENQIGEVPFEADGVNISEIEGTNLYYDSSSLSSVRLGNETASGSLVVSFGRFLSLDSIYVMAYSSQGGKLNCRVNFFRENKAVEEKEAKDMDSYFSSSWTSFTNINQKVTSFTLSSLVRDGHYDLHIAKIVLLYRQEEYQDDSSVSLPPLSEESSESVTSSSNSKKPLGKGYRIPRRRTDGEETNVYSVSQLASETYSLTVEKTLYKDQDYTDPEDVAAYYQAFNSFPQNYVGNNKNDALAYGKNGRCYFKYIYGSYSGSSDYTSSLGPWAENGATYYELDISTSRYNSSYNNGTRISRGTYRLVILDAGSSVSYWGSGSYDSVVFFTKDHYSYFQEYGNYYEGWGESFKGINGAPRKQLETIDVFEQ